MPTESLMTIQEAEKELGVSRQTIYAWLDDRTLASVKEWGRRLLLREQVEKLAQARKEKRDES